MKKRTINYLIILMCLMAITSLAYADNTEPALVSDPVVQNIYDNNITTESGSVNQVVYEVVLPTENQSAAQEVYEEEKVSDKSYFSLSYSDSQFLSYSPLETVKRVNNMQSFNDSILSQLNNIYSPWIIINESESIDDSWQAINSDTMLILGDILVTDDFSEVGIITEKDEVFCLKDGTTALPSQFKYFNKGFQTKTLAEVW